MSDSETVKSKLNRLPSLFRSKSGKLKQLKNTLQDDQEFHLKENDIGVPFNVVHRTHVDNELHWHGSENPLETFYLKKEIGRGAYAQVFKAVHVDTGNTLAIKIISAPSESICKAIMKEIEVMRMCRHASIVSYFGTVNSVENSVWILMDYCKMGSLKDLINNCFITPNADQLSLILLSVVEGLLFLHLQGIVHRDVKAANVLLDEQANAKIADFGVCGFLDKNNKINEMMGSFQWMAPEVMQDSMSYDGKADVWSLGITVIEIMQGYPPYIDLEPALLMEVVAHQPPPKPPQGPNMSPPLAAFIEECLQKDVDKRPTCVQLLETDYLQRAHDLRNRKDEVLQPLIIEYKKTKQIIKEKENRKMEVSLPKSDSSGGLSTECDATFVEKLTDSEEETLDSPDRLRQALLLQPDTGTPLKRKSKKEKQRDREKEKREEKEKKKVREEQKKKERVKEKLSEKEEKKRDRKTFTTPTGSPSLVHRNPPASTASTDGKQKDEKKEKEREKEKKEEEKKERERQKEKEKSRLVAEVRREVKGRERVPTDASDEKNRKPMFPMFSGLDIPKRGKEGLRALLSPRDSPRGSEKERSSPRHPPHDAPPQKKKSPRDFLKEQEDFSLSVVNSISLPQVNGKNTQTFISDTESHEILQSRDNSIPLQQHDAALLKAMEDMIDRKMRQLEEQLKHDLPPLVAGQVVYMLSQQVPHCYSEAPYSDPASELDRTDDVLGAEYIKKAVQTTLNRTLGEGRMDPFISTGSLSYSPGLASRNTRSRSHDESAKGVDML